MTVGFSVGGFDAQYISIEPINLCFEPRYFSFALCLFVGIHHATSDAGL